MPDTPDATERPSRRIGGGYPGGPSPRQGSEPTAPTRAVRTMGDVEAGIARRQLRIKERGRRSRMVWTAVGVGVLAAALGAGLGLMSHRSPEQIRQEHQAQTRQDLDISKEVNRTLLELWKMEDVEALRNRGRP